MDQNLLFLGLLAHVAIGVTAFLIIYKKRRIGLFTAIILILLGPVSMLLYGALLMSGKLHETSFNLRKRTAGHE